MPEVPSGKRFVVAKVPFKLVSYPCVIPGYVQMPRVGSPFKNVCLSIHLGQKFSRNSIFDCVYVGVTNNRLHCAATPLKVLLNKFLVQVRLKVQNRYAFKFFHILPGVCTSNIPIKSWVWMP